MEEDDLIKRLKSGNSTAFLKWIELHSGRFERMAIQYGCERNQAARLAEEVFIEIDNNLEGVIDEEQLLYCLYKVAIEKLEAIQSTNFTNNNNFSFEEDEQLHVKITLLDKELKTAFILSQFHGMNTAEISKVLGLSEATVDLVNSKAYKCLGEQVIHLNKRLVFLGKSYNRITLLFNTENIFQKQSEKNEALAQQPSILSKKVLFTWIAGIIILVALITVTVMTSEEYQNTSAERYVEQLKVSFEEEVTEKFIEVGLPKERLIDGEVFPMFFAESVRGEFEVMIRKLDRKIKDYEKVNKKESKREYEEIISKLELPSEMMERLFENPLTDNKIKSEEFINSYVEMFHIIQQSFFLTIFEHEKTIEDATIDGEIDIEKFLKEKETYPKDLRNALEGMVKQNIYPISLKQMAPFYPVHVNNEISKRIRDSLHEDVGGVVTLLELEPFLYYEDANFTVDVLIDYMNEMEATLFALENRTDAFGQLKDVYIHLLHEILMGSETTLIVNETGKVKEEYQLGWKKIASLDERLPSTFIMLKLVEEMEANGWKRSKIHNNLDMETLMSVYDHAEQGSLNSFKFEESTEQGEVVVSPKNPKYQADVEERYTKFAENHELDYLQDANPMVVIGVYYLANEYEDPETMWHLFNHEHIDISLQEYVKNWTQVEPLTKGVETLSVSIGGISLNGMPHVPISYEKENNSDHLAWMILDFEHPNIWMIESIPGEISNP